MPAKARSVGRTASGNGLEQLVQQRRLACLQALQHTVNVEHIGRGDDRQDDGRVVGLLLVQREGDQADAVEASQGRQAVHVVAGRQPRHDDVALVEDKAVGDGLAEGDDGLAGDGFDFGGWKRLQLTARR